MKVVIRNPRGEVPRVASHLLPDNAAAVHGVWPPHEIDHKGTVRHHNWIKNLRPATRLENSQNRRDPKGFTLKDGRYAEQIMVEGKNFALGKFDSEADARAAYLAAKLKMHPFQTIVEAT